MSLPTAEIKEDEEPSDESSSVNEVMDVQVLVLFPPRPDAIATLLHDDTYLPGVQTMLYSLRKKFSFHQRYPPEIVVLVTPNVNLEKARQNLYPSLCTRLLPIDVWDPPSNSIDSNLMKGFDKTNIPRALDNHNPGWTKLRIFSLQQYETILYIDSDCLVLKDVSHLLALNKIYTESESLVAAAPDVLPPSNFNSGVMVVRPSTKVFQTMQKNAPHLTTYDRSDTGFLNAYYNTWYTEFPPDARLSTGYNAQTALYNQTMDPETGESIFWDAQLSHDLHIVHYSEETKPWQIIGPVQEESQKKNSLLLLWKSWHKKSKNFLARDRKEQGQAEKERQERTERLQQQKRAQAAAKAAKAAADPKYAHKLITRRYKELRAQGMSTKEAMEQAREELQSKDDTDPASKVAAMFGMT